MLAKYGLRGLGLWLVFMTGCSHVPPKQPTGLRPETFWKEQARRAEVTRHIVGKVNLHLEGREHSISGKGRLLSQAPGDFRLELRDPLGRVQYLLTVQGKNLTAYYPRQRLAYVEAEAGRRYISRFMGLDFTFRELQDVFLGILPENFSNHLGKPRFESWEWDATQGAYRGVIKKDQHTITCEVDPDHGGLNSLVDESPAGKVEVAYSSPEPCCGQTPLKPSFLVARVVRVQMEKPPSVVELEWNQMERFENGRDASLFKLELPQDVEKRSLE